MKITFVKPLTPNFIKTNEGNFPIGDLDKEEIERFIELWKTTFIDNYCKKKGIIKK